MNKKILSILATQSESFARRTAGMHSFSIDIAGRYVRICFDLRPDGSAVLMGTGSHFTPLARSHATRDRAWADYRSLALSLA